MKQFYILPLVLLFTCCEEQRVSQEQLDRDKAMKDSIVLADGNKALGNIVFGIGEDEFKEQSLLFMQENDYALVGNDVQVIDGFFTDSDELCRITLVSGIKKSDTDDHPYECFLAQKYGLPTFSGVWVVGGRRLALGVESRRTDMYYSMRKSYLAAKGNWRAPEHPATKDFLSYDELPYYVLHIQNDSLYTVYSRQQTEARQRQNEERERKSSERRQNEQTKRQEQMKRL